MARFNAEGYETRAVTLEGWEARVASYRLGERWACKIDNVSPGATIAHGEGTTREEAEAEATALATKRLKRTRRMGAQK